MSQATGSETTGGGSFSSSAGGSSLASDNTDTRALNSLQEGPDGADAGDDLGSNNKSFQEGLFATLYTLTKNRTMDTSLRVAILRTVLEFMQFFRIVVNFSFPWMLQQNLWAFQAIEWTLIRPLVARQGYGLYVTVFYIISGVTLATLALTVWVALVLKGSDSVNPWLRRLIGLLQLMALVMFCIAWPNLLDYTAFLFTCKWLNIQEGLPAVHVYFTEQTCTAMPHLAHMMFAGVMVLLIVSMVLLMGMRACDVNPMNRSCISSSDEVTTIKMLVLKVIFVLVATVLDQLTTIQAGFMAVAMWGVVYYHFDGVPYYNKLVNVIWGGLWLAILDVTVILLVTQVTIGGHADPVALKDFMTKVMLYTIFPAMAAGAALMWLRLHYLAKLAKSLHNSFNVCKAAVLANTLDMDVRSSNCVVAMMGDLQKVHRFRDVRQVKIMCREMRKFDEEGQPDSEAIEFGEFLIKCGMARMPNNPSLLIMYASYMIEARKDGQAARTQLQLAQKASPNMLDTYNIYVAQQLAKTLKRDGDGLDLLSYVEFQRNYLACVRNHKAALMTQRAFWNCLLRDTISFRDLQASVQAMEAAEQRATSVYRRVMERYPSNGKVMKVYARFLEYVRNEPGAASRFYEAATKAGTSESLLALTAAEGGTAGLVAAGQIDEKVDGLAVINAQGSIMMVNQATLSMFGYQKGELEGKNVSILMPQPYSSRHDSFLQRYTETGQPHILNSSREVVALHKDRQMFPISLCVARLSGAGMDTLFIGVMRHSAASSSLDNQVVKFWATSTGMIMCADSGLADALGINAGDLVGRSFSNLCTDVEAVTRYITSAAQRQESVGASGVALDGPILRTKMLHAFLPAVDVELSLSFGGAVEAGSDCRSIILSARMLAEAAAVMVVDHKGRILHATAKLAQMLGIPVAKMSKMEMNALLPQPVTQMHGAWFKDPPLRVPAASCRAGGVVHLLAANGTKVPVTLKMTNKDDTSTGHLTHVVQVLRASEEQRLDQQRMMLSINHKGIVLSVNPGVPQSLFGFDAHQLVGQPLSQCVDIFSDWKQEHGEELSLLELLVTQVMATSSQSKTGSGCSAWRVGVHRPAAEDHHDAGGAATHSSSLLRALQPNRVQPACMKLEPMLQDASDLLIDDVTADSTPILQVALFCSDALVTVLDLDRQLNVARADDIAGLLFGVSAKSLARKSFASLAGLSGVKSFEDLLGKEGAVKKGAMKGGSAAASRAGSIRHITGVHLGDGQPLSLSMQAMSYTEQGGRIRHVVRLQLLNPVSAAMHRLLAIKDGAESATPGALETADAEPEEAAEHRAERPDSPGSSMGSDHGGGLTAEPSAVDAAPAPRSKHDHIKQWVRQASKLHASEGGSASDGSTSPRHKSPQHHHEGRGRHDATEADAQCAVRLHAPGARSKGKFDDVGSQSDEGADSMKYPAVQRAQSENGGDDASSFAGSMADGGMSDAGSGMESSMATGAAGHDEDLAVDMRRVKRLKRVSRMLSSNIAQAATISWKQRTVYLLAVILVAHVACFAVIMTQIDSRYANAAIVDNIALAMTAASQSSLRSSFIQQCTLPQFKDFKACIPAAVEDYSNKLHKNADVFRHIHHQLYLGGGEGNLPPFSDPRLVNYWTHKQLPETLYFQVMHDGLPAFVNSTRSLWEMGNILVAACDDIYFSWKTWGASIVQQPSYHYTLLQGSGSIFEAYSWSLGTFVDYTWQDLTKLSVIIIVLLVVEAAVVQLSCMTYEFVLLQRCNVAHMRMFSVFLALPSATVRFMVRQPLIVDDSSADDVDDDDLELIEGAAAAGQAAAAATSSGAPQGDALEKKKSVRLAADDDDDSKPAVTNKEGRGSAKNKGRAATAVLGKKNSKVPVGRFAAFQKKAHKYMFGWLDPRFKRNGKKLSPSSQIILRFMAPLLLWVAAVVVIFGVSYSNLQGLQGPLASLDLSAHVMYRLTRARLMGGFLAFSTSTADNAKYRAELKEALTLLQEEYRTLLYGGRMRLQAEVTFDAIAPPAIIGNAAVAEMFFTTTECLRADKTTCLPPGDPNYHITHSGLDAQINRYIDEMTRFSNLPDAVSMGNHSSYEWVRAVTQKDTFDGLQAASKLFVTGTLEKLEGVKQLHIILLVISLVALVMFVLLLYRPYIKALRRDTKAVVNMLSQLPAEVDVEGHVKSIVLGIVKTEGGRSMQGPLQGPGPSNMQMQQYGMGPPGMMGGAGMRGGPPQWGMPPGGQAGCGWFSRRNNAGPQLQANDPGMYGYGMQSNMGMHCNGDAA